ncbi:MAG: sensor domain-containing diguanylate cyclase [Anaerolineales bacterium]|jgi:diguanylate cyclase (GGDEF)-like protein/PAS domain S-box-containing protein
MKDNPPDHIFQLIVEASPAALILVDASGQICFANQAAETLFDYSEIGLTGQPVEMLVPQETQEQHQAERAKFNRHPQKRSMGSGRFLQARRRDGSQFPAEIGLSPFQLGDDWYTLSLVIDLTQLKQAEDRITLLARELAQTNERLAQLASTDALTGLYNRRAFDDHLTAQIRLMKRMGRPLSLLLVDIDDFKQYNDRYGHLAGDQVLINIASLLSQNIRASDIIARFGGEEFVVILPDTTGPAALQLAERLRLAIKVHPWEADRLTISLGAATLEFTERSLENESGDHTRLFSEADRALYYSKSKGRDRATHYSDIYLR